MKREHRLSGAWVILLAMLMTACGGGPDRPASGADQAPEAPTTDDHATDHEHHAGHDGSGRHDHDGSGHHDHDGDDHDHHGDGVRPRTTQETLAVLRSFDPERLAGLHDHHHGHDDHAHEERRHPNGVDPQRIVIPAIGVDADVIDLGLDANGEMEVPTDFAQAGWFTPGPRPGRVGPAVIAGHVDSRTGPAVFFRLTELDPGDEIKVHGADGEVVVFAVRETEQHPKDAFPTDRVYAGTPGAELRLITCGGVFDASERSYRDNIIVYAERIDR